MIILYTYREGHHISLSSSKLPERAYNPNTPGPIQPVFNIGDRRSATLESCVAELSRPRVVLGTLQVRVRI